jgi:hypothetical protein
VKKHPADAHIGFPGEIFLGFSGHGLFWLFHERHPYINTRIKSIKNMGITP